MSGTWILACFVCLSLAVSGQVSNDTRAFPVGGTATLSCAEVPYDGATKHWEKNPVLPIKYLVAIQTPLGASSPSTPFYDESNMAAAGLTGRFTVTPDSVMTATITGLRETDDGDYRCASGPSEIIHKLITYKLNSVRIQPSAPVIGNVGDTFDVTCTADSKPAVSFNWTKQGDSSFTAAGATLRISSLTMNHAGTYVCTAYHAYASDTASVQLTVSGGPNVTPVPPTDMNYCSGPGVVAGAAVGCFTGGLLVGGAAVFLFLRSRTAKNGGKKDVGNFADRQYENAPHPNQRVKSQRPGSGSDEYEVPMETVPPTQAGDDYQELRPAIYQSLQKH